MDTLARRLAGVRTRRQVVSGLAGVGGGLLGRLTIGGLAPGEVEAGKKKFKRKKQRRRCHNNCKRVCRSSSARPNRHSCLSNCKFSCNQAY